MSTISNINANTGRSIIADPTAIINPDQYLKKKLNIKSNSTLPQFDRMKGANWFEVAKDKTVIIIGAGGIGSWLTLLQSRLGSRIHIFDHDLYETHNMSGQLVRNTDIGNNKAIAISEIVRMFNTDPYLYPNPEEYTINAYSGEVVLCGLDNMRARTIAYHKWKEYVQKPSNKKPACFFQDGRLNAEQLQIFNISSHRPDHMALYEKEHLFDDKEVAEAECTFKQTSHCAAMIASHMLGFYTNWLSNIVSGIDGKLSEDYHVPFKFEYIIPFNLTMSDYAKS